MVDFVTSLHATFGRKLAKLRGSVEDAVFNENTPKWNVFVSDIISIYHVIFSNAIFVTSGGRTQKQMTPLYS